MGWRGLAAMTAHKVSTWENRCGEINTSWDGLSPAAARHFQDGEVLWRSAQEKVARSLARGRQEMKSFVRHSKTSKGIGGTQNWDGCLKKRRTRPGSGQTRPGREDLMALTAS